MTVSRPARLTVGCQVGLRGLSYTITALAGGTVALAGVTGEVLAMPAAELLTDASFTVLTARTQAPLPARGVLDGLPAEVAGRAQWWERQVTEVLTGVPAGKPGGHGPGSQPGSLTCADQLACHVAMKRRPGLG